MILRGVYGPGVSMFARVHPDSTTLPETQITWVMNQRGTVVECERVQERRAILTRLAGSSSKHATEMSDRNLFLFSQFILLGLPSLRVFRCVRCKIIALEH